MIGPGASVATPIIRQTRKETQVVKKTKKPAKAVSPIKKVMDKMEAVQKAETNGNGNGKPDERELRDRHFTLYAMLRQEKEALRALENEHKRLKAKMDEDAKKHQGVIGQIEDSLDMTFNELEYGQTSLFSTEDIMGAIKSTKASGKDPFGTIAGVEVEHQPASMPGEKVAAGVK